MTKDDAELAKEQAGQARSQAKAAAKSGGRALRDAAEDAVDAVSDEARDATEKIEGAAEDAVEAARRINLVDASVGVGALAVSIVSGVVAYSKLRQAFTGR